jgi:putative alpha-1,2-mannosidase
MNQYLKGFRTVYNSLSILRDADERQERVKALLRRYRQLAFVEALHLNDEEQGMVDAVLEFA